MKCIEQLSFIFVYAFYLNIKHRLGIDYDPARFIDIICESMFIIKLYPAPFCAELRVLRQWFEAAQLVKIGDPAEAKVTADQISQLRIDIEQPASGGDAVCF